MKVANCRLLCLCFLILASGCATSHVFTPYPAISNQFILNVAADRCEDSIHLLESLSPGKDRILYELERARIYQVCDSDSQSIALFRRALDDIKAEEQRAVISISRAGAQSATLLTNDNAIPYLPPPYERVFAHIFQALNYLFTRDVESAGVEARVANFLQKQMMERHEKEVLRARREAEKAKVAYGNIEKKMAEKTAYLESVTAKVKNSFQNAYSFFISGLVYEMQGELDDAYIDYKKALEIAPANKYLRTDVERLAIRLNMTDDIEYFRRIHGMFRDSSAKPDIGACDLIVVYESGFVPQKREFRLDVPTENGIVSMAFPIYEDPEPPSDSLEIRNARGVLGETQRVCQVYPLAVKALLEEMPVMIIRQALRLTGKAVLQKQMKDSAGAVGAIVSSVYNVLSERADLRGWYSLPAEIQIFRGSVAPGAHHFEFLSEVGSVSCDVTVPPGRHRHVVVRVIRAGERLFMKHVVF